MSNTNNTNITMSSILPATAMQMSFIRMAAMTTVVAGYMLNGDPVIVEAHHDGHGGVAYIHPQTNEWMYGDRNEDGTLAYNNGLTERAAQDFIEVMMEV